METNIFNRPAGRTLAEIIESTIETERAIFEADGEITPELEEQIAKDEADMAKKIDGYNAAYREEDARAKALADEIKRLQALKKTAENAAKRVKDMLKWNMERLGVDRVNGKTCKAYFSSSTAVVADEAVLLKPYDAQVEELRKALPAYVTIEVGISKTELKTAIGNLLPDETIEGASMETSRTIVLK